VVTELGNVPGFLGADLLRRDMPDAIEFTVISRWASLDAIRAFAGDDPTKALVEPGAVAALREFDDRATHHEVLERVAAVAG
jgi:heme-degrading monooxygenase HmoA